MKKVILHMALLFILSGCGFVYEEQLTGNYYLVAVDVKDDMTVCYHDEPELWLGIGKEGVYEVGYDEHFILTKNYKVLLDSAGMSLHRYDKSITEYYIIPVDNTQNHFDAQENYFGAFTEEEFEAKRKELGVSDDITFKKL
ncbi:DUF3997 domain-containing protein [Parabacteroides sp.]